ncbi:hypothetical protein TR2A62_0285 [Thalassobium sp. R2A62]|nr:hypothetical protein TR2A62_0285 [Thalassobium sp. R2A62]
MEGQGVSASPYIKLLKQAPSWGLFSFGGTLLAEDCLVACHNGQNPSIHAGL